VEVRVADAEGNPMPQGEIGMIEIRGPNVFQGYWRMPEKTKAEFRKDGFFITGDLGVIGPGGYLSIVGRGKDLIITGGLFAYLRRANPELLGLAEKWGGITQERVWYRTRKLWYGLAGLMLLSPLGLIAAGTAWGEWGAADFASPEARQAIAMASHNVAPPTAAPQGFARLAGIWQAPIPDYAPAFMHSESFGYILSAFFGIGLILLVCLIVSALVRKRAVSD